MEELSRNEQSTPQTSPPPAPDWLFAHIDEASRQSRALFFVLVGFLAYCALTVFNTSDREIVLDNEVRMPLVDVDVPLAVFLFVAPLVSLVLYAYLQLHISRATSLMRLLRHRYPDTPPERPYPWMLYTESGLDSRFAGLLRRAIVAGALWWMLPVVLVLFSLFMVKTHRPELTYVAALMPFAGAMLAASFWWSQRVPSATVQRAGHRAGPVVLVAVGALFSLFQMLVVAPRARQGVPWPDVLAPRVAEDAFRAGLLRRWVSADVSYEVLVSRPEYGAELVPWADLHGARLEGANMAATVLERADLRHARLNGANLEGANLRRAFLADANLEQAVLYKADLSGSDLTGANLRGARLREADLTGADLTGADLSGTVLRYAKLSGAVLDDATLDTADLLYADLHGASLRQARVCRADLRFSNLTEADLTLANLFLARLHGATMARGSARDAYLIDTAGASLDQLTTMRSLFGATLAPALVEALRATHPELLDIDSERIDIYRSQDLLRRLGLYYGEIDGQVGPVMREGLARFQQQMELPATGRLDMATRNALDGLAQKQPLEPVATLTVSFQHGLDSGGLTLEHALQVLSRYGYVPEGPPHTLEEALADGELVTAIARFQAAVGLIPDGLLGPVTGRRLQDALAGRLEPLATVAEAKRLLQRDGSYGGRIDDVYDRRFEQVLREFQGRHCLTPDGLLDQTTLDALRGLARPPRQAAQTADLP